MIKIPSSEITPEHVYLSRRDFLKSMGMVSAASLFGRVRHRGRAHRRPDGAATTPPEDADGMKDELGDAVTPYNLITHYNNYYEFSTDKADGRARLVGNFPTSPWTVEVGGMVNNPKTYDIDESQACSRRRSAFTATAASRPGRWSFPGRASRWPSCSTEVEPTSDAKYVRFTDHVRSRAMPGQKSGCYDGLTSRGLRLDEAMNDLALLATGMYGKTCPPQDGAPLRLAVPWKYGFKSIKSIVKIDLVAEMPTSLWMAAAPQRIRLLRQRQPAGGSPALVAGQRAAASVNCGRRPTLKFNGYADEVADLYAGMDLRANF